MEAARSLLEGVVGCTCHVVPWNPMCCGDGWLGFFWFWLSWTPCVPKFLTDGPHHP